jgi:hypothetical protein
MIATDILVSHRDQLDLIATALLEDETLEADDFVALLEGTKRKDLPSASPSRSVPIKADSEELSNVGDKPSLNLPPSPSPA